jgi:PhnB protein
MKPSVHLTFAGNCEEAFEFYVRVLGAKLDALLKYGDSPAAAEVPSEWRSKVVHATLSLGGRQIAGADVLPAQYERPRGFYLLLDAASPKEARRAFDALAEKGTVAMPLQKTFWSPAFGALTDRFGIPWELSAS